MSPLIIITFIILFFLSAFFSGSEIALVSISPHKVNSLLKEKRLWAKSLQKVKNDVDRLLIIILIWNNLVNTFTASLATSIAISIAKSSWLWTAEASAVWIATFIITICLLIFWEILPKSIASKNSIRIALFIAPIYVVLMFVFFPIIWTLDKLIKLFSKDKPKEMITEEEIDSFIDIWKESGGMDEDTHGRIKSILEFDDILVAEVMTPRIKMDAMNINLSVEKAMTYFLSHTHTRIPIYTWTIDKIDYFITSRDLMKEVRAWNANKKLFEIKLKEVLKVPSNQSISMLLESLKKSYKTMAIVIDEYGWVAWLVTIEDVIEEVFGKIRDETDKESEEFIKVGENSALVESEVLIEDVLKEFDLDLEEIWLDEKDFDGETISYAITHILDRFPETWEIISFDVNSAIKWTWKLTMKVLDVYNDAKIWKVDVKFVKHNDAELEVKKKRKVVRNRDE